MEGRDFEIIICGQNVEANRDVLWAIKERLEGHNRFLFWLKALPYTFWFKSIVGVVDPNDETNLVTPEVRDLKMRVHELETSIGMHIQRRVHKMQDIIGELAGYGNDHPKYTYEDWVDAVRSGETRDGYLEWVCVEYEKDGGKL